MDEREQKKGFEGLKRKGPATVNSYKRMWVWSSEEATSQTSRRRRVPFLACTLPCSPWRPVVTSVACLPGNRPFCSVLPPSRPPPPEPGGPERKPVLSTCLISDKQGGCLGFLESELGCGGASWRKRTQRCRPKSRCRPEPVTRRVPKPECPAFSELFSVDHGLCPVIRTLLSEGKAGVGLRSPGPSRNVPRVTSWLDQSAFPDGGMRKPRLRLGARVYNARATRS